MKNLKSNKGFSLVELLVVITIIAILSVVAYTAVGGQTAKAKNAKRKQDLATIQSALEIFYINNNNKYPDMLDGADGTTMGKKTDLTPKYMPKMAFDPATKLKYSYKADASKSNKEYQLGATLETENTPYYEAYVIGNGTELLSGVLSLDATKTCTKIKDKSTICIPYAIK